MCIAIVVHTTHFDVFLLQMYTITKCDQSFSFFEQIENCTAKCEIEPELSVVLLAHAQTRNHSDWIRYDRDNAHELFLY